MKSHSQIQSLLLPWIEQSSNDRQSKEVVEHLRGCEACRRYFESMALALTPSSAAPEKMLSADPYLPVRILAHVQSLTMNPRPKRHFVLSWSLRTAAFIVAVVMGIYMGEKLSYQAPTVTDQRIIREFSESFGEVGLGERWQTVASATEEATR